MTASRRSFLRAAAALAATGTPLSTRLALQLAGMGTLAATQARSANTDGYKALVCLFMNGGNDSHNWLLPTDTSNRASYAAARGELAWPAERVQAIDTLGQASGRSFGMPVELGPLRRWYGQGRLGWLANVGTLERPLSKAEYMTGVGLPAKLFSHNDQAATWQSLQPEGAPSGWGGRMGDLLMAANAQPVFTAVSATGNAVYLAGSQVVPYQVSTSGPVVINGAQDGWRAGSSAVPGELRRLLAETGDTDHQAEYLKVVQRSLATAGQLQAALAAGPSLDLPTTPITLPDGTTLPLDGDALAKQLRIVARLVAIGPALGMRRQVFMVSLGGFDSHANQMRDQPLMMGRVAHSVDWFLSTMQGLGLLDNVLLFSASDFGRTLVSNGQGSDHGWGGHHFLAGASVRGGRIHGVMPVTALGTTEDVGSGRLLPSTSVTQYAAQLGGWMGLGRSELETVLPNLGAFDGGALSIL